MKQTIKFKKSTNEPISYASPWEISAKSSYQDLLLKPDYANRRFKIPLGTTWIRLVPALQGSGSDWLLGVHALTYAGGRHAHPRGISIDPGAKSVFDHAWVWCNRNKPESLYSKTNKEGYKLLADPVSVFWLLVEENGKTVARLLIASGYDGSRGGVPGLGHQIWALTKEVDEEGNPLGNPADPDVGTQICIEKKQAEGSRFPSYSLRLGRVEAPIDEMLAKMETNEIDAIVPIEQVVYLPEEDEEWSLLEKVIDPETVQEIRSSVE